ncbi:DEAD/DEAH box helicase [Paenibacillus sp. OV219]|uniref:DEAD/DEAH box helicase n=1 Tax=Paenibacillus sp. OV219 TaxID=1884377 RepID=UPI0008ACF0B3|nr:helicase-related protein [Paenibacillus sp. OV219]SEN64367.1 competence protein ComFA [Paenibacillus sp. OV219]
MKVVVYAALAKGQSWASWSVAPEVDYAYWLGSGYREAAVQAAQQWGYAGDWNRGSKTQEKSCEAREVEAARQAVEVLTIMAWSVPIPLGHAVQIAERWSGKARDEQGVREELTRLIREAWASDDRLGLPVQKREDACVVRGEASGGTADAMELAARACRAASLLQGRALLSSEVLGLLGAAGAAEPASAAPQPWSAAAPALQLAALLGLLRLGGAVAPQPQSRLLRWRAALGARPRLRLLCQRCGSGTARMRRTACAGCGRACAYCEACLTMGRSRECGLLILGTPSSQARSAANASSATCAPSTAWTLSPAQAEAAAAALGYMQAQPAGHSASRRALLSSFNWLAPLAGHSAPRRLLLSVLTGSAPSRQRSASRRFLLSVLTGSASTRYPKPQLSSPPPVLHSPRRFLLWAVTGAGKTEMIFPLIEAVLQRGGKALIATPRRDVVLELDPRIRKAFPNANVVTLYGGSKQRWEQGEVTIATTHQLFRFQHGFDLVIIDEIDAFPYHNDPMLQYAADKVCKPGGVNVLLSATPPADLRRAAKEGRLAHARVPVRFHRHPLPVPKQHSIPPVQKLLNQRRFPQRLVQAIQQSLDRGAQLFLFVQQIREVDPLVRQLRTRFPGIVIEGTSSKDEDRARRVVQFRERTIRLLVTTTILERGVTIPKSDVYILDADGKLFDDASLIQMAGRAGRSSDDPAGMVYFFASSRTRSQQSAIRQIRAMNRIARRKGFLLTPKERR